jgi:hypothetical protein
LIAIAATAEKPPDEERHDGGCVGAAPGNTILAIPTAAVATAALQ